MNTFYFEQFNRFKKAGSLSVLEGMQRGIEKENIRVTSDGHYAHTLHPKSLGSPLFNPNLTLDFSETLLEQITSPCRSREELFQELKNINTWVGQKLAQIHPGQFLWPYSMPLLTTEQEINQIKIAEFGRSAAGQMKTIYRQGLVHRYGKAMQLISGIHYNLSWPNEFFKLLGPLPNIPLARDEPYEQALKSQRYLGVIRNFYRYQWLIPLLFGASPVCFSGSLARGDKPTYLNPIDKKNVSWGRGATSLRLGPIGYQNKEQAGINLSFNTIQEYARDLLSATNMPDPNFSCIAIKDELGNYQQLNNHVLQIENEFYSAIRPKAHPKYQERTSVALARHGIEYLELRALDLDLFSPEGMSMETSTFCDLWLMHLLLMPSPNLTEKDKMASGYNLNVVIGHGRDTQTLCYSENGLINIQEQALILLHDMQSLAEYLDKQGKNNEISYRHVLEKQIDKIKNFSLLPASQIINQWQESGVDFVEFLLRKQQEYHDLFLTRKLPIDIQKKYDKQAKDSFVLEQQLIETDRQSIDEYINQYFAQTI